MSNASRFITTVIVMLSGLSTTLLCQWEGYVTCHETWIDLRPSDGWNGVIPRCMDTLRIGNSRAMKRHASTVDTVCARLFRLGSLGRPIRREEIPVETICEGPQQVTLIPAYRLAVTDDNDTPLRYEVQLYCSYWHGEDEHDTTYIEFWKATGFKAYARAVEIETGDDITSLGLVAPTVVEQSHFVYDGMQLIAYSGAGYEFDHWTCSEAGLLPDPLARRQLLDSLCWPVLRAVEYVGHFRRIPSSVHQRQTSCSRVIRSEGSILSIENPCMGPGFAMIYDMQGQQICMIDIGTSHVRVPSDSFAIGIYVAVVYDLHGATTHSFMITKE